MTYANVPGSKIVPIGPNWITSDIIPAGTNITLDAANEAVMYIGQIETSDGGSHTINTTGSSSIGWRTGTTTFANGATTVVVGIAPVDTAVGPPARASNTSDVINFDVAASFTGGGGGITTAAWQTSVPTTGTKTIAHGDLVAVCVQMTARGGVDSVIVVAAATGAHANRPIVTTFLGGFYAINSVGLPNVFITFSDGAFGWIYCGEIANSRTITTFNSGSATKEYGQLYNLPFPVKVNGIYAWINPSNNLELVLYSAPLGTPVAEKTLAVDANPIGAASGRRFIGLFSSPYTLAANTDVAAVVKPDAANCSVYLRNFASANHRLSEMGGALGYGVSRASGAFANINSSLDQIYIGLLVSAFDEGGGGGGGLNVLGGQGGVVQ